jgi:hypothetical protein
MAKPKSKDNPYSGIAEKVEKIMAGLAEQMPNLSANDLAVVHRTMKFLARDTRAGAERLAILHLLGPMKRCRARSSISFAASV